MTNNNVRENSKYFRGKKVHNTLRWLYTTGLQENCFYLCYNFYIRNNIPARFRNTLTGRPSSKNIPMSQRIWWNFCIRLYVLQKLGMQSSEYNTCIFVLRGSFPDWRIYSLWHKLKVGLSLKKKKRDTKALMSHTWVGSNNRGR